MKHKICISVGLLMLSGCQNPDKIGDEIHLSTLKNVERTIVPGNLEDRTNLEIIKTVTFTNHVLNQDISITMKNCVNPKYVTAPLDVELHQSQDRKELLYVFTEAKIKRTFC